MKPPVPHCGSTHWGLKVKMIMKLHLKTSKEVFIALHGKWSVHHFNLLAHAVKKKHYFHKDIQFCSSLTTAVRTFQFHSGINEVI